MKKKISILLLTVVITSMLISTVVSATETSTANGFYNIEEVEDIVITVYSGNKVVNSVEQAVDADDVEDVWYVNSDRFEIEYTAATPGNYYGVILVEGSDLPTIDNAIFYIDQVKADSSTISFNVYPKTFEETTDMTLYISSSDEDEGLVSFSLNYAVGVDVLLPEYTLGDVDGDDIFSPSDALWVLKLCVGKLNTEPNLAAMELAADVDKDGICTPTDALRILQFCVGKINSFEEIQGGNR